MNQIQNIFFGVISAVLVFLALSVAYIMGEEHLLSLSHFIKAAFSQP